MAIELSLTNKEAFAIRYLINDGYSLDDEPYYDSIQRKLTKKLFGGNRK